MYRIVHSRKSHQRIRRFMQLAALGELLPDREIEAVCRDLGHKFRKRQLLPGVMLRSMVYRGLHPDHSIAAMLADLAGVLEPEQSAPTDSAWCQARCRLPQEVITAIIRRRARQCRDRFGQWHKWHGRWVFIADGSTVSMPDEPALVEAFGYADTRKGKSRFPVGRITFVELAGLEEIWDYRLDDYHCSENAQFQNLWRNLPTGCICLLDRKFCSFHVLANLRRRRIDAITPLNQSRDPRRLISRGRQMGPNDWIVPLDLAPQLRRKYDDPALPELLWVRLIRVKFWRGEKLKTLWLVTTLMNSMEYPAAVRREVASIILGHNLVWTLMHQAAEQTDTPVEDISFAGAIKTVLAFCPALRHASGGCRNVLYRKMLAQIARQTNHHPFDRVEPRLIKRETSRFTYLREPRWKARLKCLT